MRKKLPENYILEKILIMEKTNQEIILIFIVQTELSIASIA